MVVWVTRLYMPTHVHQEWEAYPFERVIWFWDTDETQAPKESYQPAPKGYAPSVLRAYTVGRQLSLPELDEILEKEYGGWTRGMIEAGLEE